jgi:hypothetical protein
MIRRIHGLSSAGASDSHIAEGNYLVRVAAARYRWDRQKPFYSVKFAIVEPAACAQQTISGRIYCSVKALWKFSWFLRDFGYDLDLLGRDEIDERSLVGLTGVVRISYRNLNGQSFLNLDAFAPAEHWGELGGDSVPQVA